MRPLPNGGIYPSGVRYPRTARLRGRRWQLATSRTPTTSSRGLSARPRRRRWQLAPPRTLGLQARPRRRRWQLATPRTPTTSSRGLSARPHRRRLAPMRPPRHERKEGDERPIESTRLLLNTQLSPGGRSPPSTPRRLRTERAGASPPHIGAPRPGARGHLRHASGAAVTSPLVMPRSKQTRSRRTLRNSWRCSRRSAPRFLLDSISRI